MAVDELYDFDFFEWTQRNAELLNRGCLEQADIPHIAEELADMGNRDRREVQSYLRRLIMHLLKWQFQPIRRTPNWRSSINNSRVQIKGILSNRPACADTPLPRSTISIPMRCGRHPLRPVWRPALSPGSALTISTN